MVKAAAPPELPPIAARPSGFLVKMIRVIAGNPRQDFCFDELGVSAGNGVVFQAALAALGVAAAGVNHNGDQGGQAAGGDHVVKNWHQAAR